jgi:hypothetical protein
MCNLENSWITLWKKGILWLALQISFLIAMTIYNSLYIYVVKVKIESKEPLK